MNAPPAPPLLLVVFGSRRVNVWYGCVTSLAHVPGALVVVRPVFDEPAEHCGSGVNVASTLN